MGLYIKNWSLADWKELLKWAKIGANNAMIGEFAEVEEIPPHGRLIDADALKQNTYEIYDPLGVIEAVPVDVIDNAPTVLEAEGGE